MTPAYIRLEAARQLLAENQLQQEKIRLSGELHAQMKDDAGVERLKPMLEKANQIVCLCQKRVDEIMAEVNARSKGE